MFTFMFFLWIERERDSLDPGLFIFQLWQQTHGIWFLDTGWSKEKDKYEQSKIRLTFTSIQKPWL